MYYLFKLLLFNSININEFTKKFFIFTETMISLHDMCLNAVKDIFY